MPVRNPRREAIRRGLSYALLTIVGITTLLPFVWMLSASLKPGGVFYEEDRWWQNWVPGKSRAWIIEDGREIPVRKVAETETGIEVRVLDGEQEPLFVPRAQYHEGWRAEIRWRNFPDAWNAVNLGRGYSNSLLVAFLVTLGQVFTSSMAAFAFARLKFFGRDLLFFGYLATMMIPSAVTMIPVYVLFARGPALLDEFFGTSIFTADFYLFGTIEVGHLLGMDSYMALVLPGIFSAFGTFMLRQLFMTVPAELEEAARMDGCTAFGVYWRIFLPISKPAVATLALMTFMGAWRNFTWPLIVAQSAALRTLPVMLSYFIGEHSQEYNLLMAGSLIVLIPEILLFVFVQRYFVEGIRMGAVKG